MIIELPDDHRLTVRPDGYVGDAHADQSFDLFDICLCRPRQLLREKIKNAGETVLIAGGKQKVDALFGLLTGEYPQAPIDEKNLTLVTDAWTAETIIQRISQRQAGKQA
jgi:hypothetical protein